MICDSCSNAIMDDSLGLVDEAWIEMVAVEFGGDVADHTCETIDNPEAVQCDCNCH